MAGNEAVREAWNGEFPCVRVRLTEEGELFDIFFFSATDKVMIYFTIHHNMHVSTKY